MEIIDNLLREATTSMEKAYKHVQIVFSKIRTTQVHSEMLKEVQVDYYGVNSPINQLASIHVEDSSTLVIKPWEKKLLPAIEKAIIKQNPYGFITRNDNGVVYAKRPSLTEEFRKKLVKQIDHKTEDGKVEIRNIRKRIKERIKKIKAEDEVKLGENELQKLTDKWIEKIETLHIQKKKEIMKV